MYSATQMRQYQQQAILSSSPDQLIAKLYDLGVSACHREDRAKVKAVLVELISSLNFEVGGEIANRLYSIYEFCLEQLGNNDYKIVGELLSGLRDAWREGVMARKAA